MSKYGSGGEKEIPLIIDFEPTSDLQNDECVVKEVVEEAVNAALNVIHSECLKEKCSNVCQEIAQKLRNKGFVVKRVFGFWMGPCERTAFNRNHEWLLVYQQESESDNTIVFDPTYVQFVKDHKWTWGGCKKAVFFSAVLFYDNEKSDELKRRRDHGYPKNLDMSTIKIN